MTYAVLDGDRKKQLDKVKELTPEPARLLTTEEFVEVHFRNFVHSTLDRMPCEEIRTALLISAWELYEREKPSDAEPFSLKLAQIQADFIKTLPNTLIIDPDNEKEPEYTVPLRATLKNVEALYLLPFRSELFPKLRRQIEMMGESLGLPENYKGDPKDYLRHTPFYQIFLTQVPFSIPREARFAGEWVVAPPGRGKSTYLIASTMRDMNTPCSIILMDSKAELIDVFRDLKPSKNVVVVDPVEGLAINPLDLGAHSVELLEYIMSGLAEAPLTPLQKTLYRSVLNACVEVIPNPTLATFRDIIANGIKPYQQYIDRLDPDERSFFEKEFQSQQYNETKQQVLWRLRLLMSNKIIRSILSAPRTKLNFKELIEGDNLILLNTSREILGDFASAFLSRLYIALIRSAGQSRAKTAQPCYFTIDEAQTCIATDTVIPIIFQELRSRKIALRCAHQEIQQIKSADVLGALSNCAIRLANSDEEAPALAPRLRTTPEHLRGLKVGSFATFVRDQTPTAVTLHITPANLADVPKLTPDESRAREKRFRDEYCYEQKPRVTVKDGKLVPKVVVEDDDAPIMNWGEKP